jgi:hypothetical protein
LPRKGDVPFKLLSRNAACPNVVLVVSGSLKGFLHGGAGKVQPDAQVTHGLLRQPALFEVGSGLLPAFGPEGLPAVEVDRLQDGTPGLTPPGVLLLLRRPVALRAGYPGQLRQLANDLREVLALGRPLPALQAPEVLHGAAADPAGGTTPEHGFRVHVERGAALAPVPGATPPPLGSVFLPLVALVREDVFGLEPRQDLLLEEVHKGGAGFHGQDNHRRPPFGRRASRLASAQSASCGARFAHACPVVSRFLIIAVVSTAVVGYSISALSGLPARQGHAVSGGQARQFVCKLAVSLPRAPWCSQPGQESRFNEFVHGRGQALQSSGVWFAAALRTRKVDGEGKG